MALDTLTATFKAQLGWTAQKNITGSDYSANVNSTTIAKSGSIGTSAANAAAGGSDELYSAVTSLSASSSASIDLSSLTDILGQTSIALVRVKAILIRLLSTTDDSVIGTAASSINIDNTVANALSAQSNTGWFNNAHEGTATGGAGDATGSKFCIPNGGVLSFYTPVAAGVAVDGTHKIIKVTNNDSGVTAKVQITVVGGTS